MLSLAFINYCFLNIILFLSRTSHLECQIPRKSSGYRRRIGWNWRTRCECIVSWMNMINFNHIVFYNPINLNLLISMTFFELSTPFNSNHFWEYFTYQTQIIRLFIAVIGTTILESSYWLLAMETILFLFKIFRLELLERHDWLHFMGLIVNKNLLAAHRLASEIHFHTSVVQFLNFLDNG